MALELEIEGKVALVLASSSGIGRAAALRLAAEGAIVVVVGRDTEKLKEVASHGDNIHPIALDLSSDAVETLVPKVLEMFGQLDIVILNTGGPTIQPFIEASTEQWDSAYRILFRPVVTVARAAARHMADRKSGAMLFITSTWTKQPAPGSCLTASFRAGLSALSKLLSIELGPHQVRVNQLMPGTTATARLESQIDGRVARNGTTREEELAKSFAAIPFGRWAEPEETADAIAFLVSERAKYITGQTLAVDGGSIKTVF